MSTQKSIGIRAIQLSVFWAFLQGHRELELAPTKESRDLEIPPTGELNASGIGIQFFLEVFYRVCYTPLISLNIVWLGVFHLACVIS